MQVLTGEGGAADHASGGPSGPRAADTALAGVKATFQRLEK